MPAVIFNSSAVKALKDILKFKSGQRIITNVSADPSSVATDGNAGDIYVRTTGQLYVKKDSGSTTNWDLVIDDANLASQLANYILSSEKGAALGVATLDAGGKIPAAQLPNSIMDYLGTWAASTNTPTLTNGTGNAGDVYVASDAGTVNFGAGNITFAAGDWVIYSGSIWEKSVNSNAVASVNGFTGVVVLDTDDIAEGATNLYFTDERAQDAVGTILTDTATVDFTYNDAGPSITADVLPAGIDKNALGGSALSIANGGTGQTGQTAAFDALAPTTTKGDLIAHNGTDNVRQAVGTDGYVLTADSGAATGVSWQAPSSATAVQNLIINGNMNIRQRIRPTFYSATPTGYAYACDRFAAQARGSTNKSWAITATTVGAPTTAQTGVPLDWVNYWGSNSAISLATDDLIVPCQYNMEGYDYTKIHGKQVSLGFWIKTELPSATYPVTIPVAFGNDIKSYVTSVTMSADATWEYKTVTLTMDTTDADWELNNNQHALKISIASGSGTDFEAPSANTWVSGEYHTLSTANYNILDDVNNFISITGVSLVLGATALSATGFITRGADFSEELEMCQRYFQKSYDLDTEPETLTLSSIVAIYVPNAQTRILTVQYLTRLRDVASTFSVYNPSIVLANTARGLTGGANISVSGFTGGEANVTLILDAASSATDYYGFHWTADADFYTW